MKAADCVLYWDDNSDRVTVRPRGREHEPGRDSYRNSGLGAYTEVRDMTPIEATAYAFIEAMQLIIRDGCDPQAVHRAMLNVDEYNDALSDDVPGKREPAENR